MSNACSVCLQNYLHYFVCADDNIDETYGINVQFEESEEEVCSVFCVLLT